MKLTVFFLFLSLIQVSATVYSQATRFSFTAENKQVVDVLRQIEENSNFRFFFLREQVDVERQVTVTARQATVEQILEELFKGQPINYEFANEALIVLTREDNPLGGTSNYLKNSMQQRTVSGKVTDSSGQPLPGVTVVIKGTTQGTVTNAEGNYSITNMPNGATLIFSFVGMRTQEVVAGNQMQIDVSLDQETFGVDEVVVTALGIRRQQKTLTYAQQTVSSEELLKARNINFMDALSGKAAGLDIQQSSSGAGGSTQIVLRGNKSLSGASIPLFVIDGVPISNRRSAQPGMWGGIDGGDGLSQINQDDIESINILRGANAAALYGSEGVNGVVVITTKKGKEGTTMVKVNSGVTFENVTLLPEFQYRYGSENGSIESWSYTKGDYGDTYIKDYFKTGTNFQNSINVSGGTKTTTAFFSYSNISAAGVGPTNEYGKHNFSFRQSTKLFNDRLTISSNTMLATEKAHNRYASGYGSNPLINLYYFPRDRDFNQYKEQYEVHNSDRNMMWPNWYTDTSENPYWTLNNRPLDDEVKRLIGGVTLNYEFSKKLNLQVRGNFDGNINLRERKERAGSRSTEVHANGAWSYNRTTSEMYYADALLTFADNFGAFSLNAVGGASYKKYESGVGVSVGTGIQGLVYPNMFMFSNLPDNVTVYSAFGGRGIKEGLFGNATIGFKEMVFVDVSGRNDWASSLAGTGNDSYFYPMVGLTTIFSEMFTLPSFVSFAKARASYSVVGNEVPFNRVNPQHTINANAAGVTLNTQVPFRNLKPELISSFEVGGDVRFFNGRFGIDLTHYNINSKDQFIALNAPSGSGYTIFFVNAGEIENKGIELTVDITPIQTNSFRWTSTFNYTKNTNRVIELHPDLKNPISLGSEEGYDSKIVAGGRISDLYVHKFLRDSISGSIILDTNTGSPLKTQDKEYIGNLNPDWSLGMNNSINYKRVGLSFLVNGKFGGVAVSQTESLLDGMGVSERTAAARDIGSVTIDAVKDGEQVSSIDPFKWYRAVGDRNGILENYVYDRTNVRLAEVSLSYDFILNKHANFIKNASLSFFGQNLLFLYIKAPFDPELNLGTDGMRNQSLDNFMFPSTRRIGFNLSLTL